MSSYLTGWDSSENIGLEDIYNLESRYKTVQQTHKRNRTQEKSKSNKKKTTNKKQIIGQLKNSFKNKNISFPKRDKPSITINNFYNNIVKKFVNKGSELNKLRKAKQNIRAQICKSQLQQKSRIQKINTNAKLSVVNIFEKLQMKQPSPSKYQQFQKKNGYLTLKSKQQTRSISQSKVGEMIVGRTLQKDNQLISSKQNVYRQLLSYGSSPHELSYVNQNFVRKIHKSASDYHSGYFQYKKLLS